MKAEIARAAEILRAGGLVAFPTETVYGLGARADRPKAVAKIFAAKERPNFDPLIAHSPDLTTAEHYAFFDEMARELGRRFWPGPLTLVLPRRPVVCDLATSGLATVGIRVPAHPLARELLEACGLPIAAPSANRFGYVSPTTAGHVREGLRGRVEMILDGGPCTVGVESTIVALEGGTARLLRPGGVPREAIEAALGQKLTYGGHQAPVDAPQAPGMLKSHYAPTRPVECFDSLSTLEARAKELNGDCALLGCDLPEGIPAQVREDLGKDAIAMAAGLFAALRRLDAAPVTAILALLPCPEGLGLAVRDRLIRAGGSRPVG